MWTEQSQQALATANRLRLARAEIKRQIHDGKLNLLDALDMPDVANMKVSEVLKARRYLGDNAVRRILVKAQISPFGFGGESRIKDLTDRQMGLLRSAIRVWESGAKSR